MTGSVPMPMGADDGQEKALTALELMGLAGLLRSWRAAAGEKRGLGRPLTQKEVAQAIGRSVRWYIDLEGGATPRLGRPVLDALAEELMLTPDQEATLHLYALGGAVDTTIPAPSPEAAQLLQRLLDQQMPDPAYISDVSWKIIGYNKAMEEWYPWVREPGANLMYWALCSQEARRWYLNWEQHATVYLEQLRFALAQHPSNRELQELLTSVLDDPVCEKLWHSSTEVRRSGDGRHFYEALPRHNYEIIHLVSNVLYPASLPNARLVVITWLKNDPKPKPASQATARPSNSFAGSRAIQQLPISGTYPTAATVQKVAELAGRNAIELPALSRLAGERCQLTYSPDSRTVFWATQQEDGRWRFDELDPYIVTKQFPQSRAAMAAPDEYKLLFRAQYPSDPRRAAELIDALLPDHRARMEDLTEILRTLREQHPDQFEDA